MRNLSTVNPLYILATGNIQSQQLQPQQQLTLHRPENSQSTATSIPPLEQELPTEQQKLKLLEQQLLIEQQKLKLPLEQQQQHQHQHQQKWQLPYHLHTRDRYSKLQQPQPQPQPQPQYPLLTPVNSELPQPLKICDLASVIEYVKNKNYPLYVREETQLQLPAHYRLNTSQLPKPQQQYPLDGLGNESQQLPVGYSPQLVAIIKYVEENKIPQPPPKEKSDIEREREIIYFISEFKKLIQNGEHINYRNDLGQTFFIRSVIDEHYAVTKALLRLEQVDVNAVDNMNYNALHYASSKGDKEIIQAFAERKDVNFNAFAGNHNATALHIGAKNGFDEVVQALIDAKASVDICNSDKHTALHVAVFFGKEKVVKVLLKAGADLDRRDNKGNTALNIAGTIEDEAKRSRIIRLLAKQKVDLKKSITEKTLLASKAIPAKRKYVKIKDLVDLNENPTNNLRFFALECNFHKIRELLEKGADPNWVANKVDYPPITLAALSPKKDDYEKIKIIALLYKYGAKIDLKNFYTLFNNKLITKSLREDIKKLSTQDRENFSVDEFLESLQKPGREVFYSNPRKSPSSDVEPSNYRA